jgi:hypothetical protein
MSIQAYVLPGFSMIARAFLFALPLVLAGCDLEALLADPKVVQREADAKAIGSACRYGMRSIEDCYTMNEKASKAAVFFGWKEMDQYMRDNKIDGVEAKAAKAEPTATVAAGEALVSMPAKGSKDAVRTLKKATEVKARPTPDSATGKAETTQH